MKNRIRRNPLVCLIISLFNLATGKLRLTNLYVDNIVSMEDNSKYKIFRHITVRNTEKHNVSTVFIVSFKFAVLSHKANKRASIIPMLLITGFPGFVKKIYAVNSENGYWQGMYQWKSLKNLEEYKKSFIFRVMNKRALPESIKSFQIENSSLDSYFNK